MQSADPKSKHIAKAAQANATTKALSKSLLFATPKKNFKIFSPTLQKKLKHPTHNPRLTRIWTGYGFSQTDTATRHGRRRASANMVLPQWGLT